jgi:hypothetical protein
LHLKQGAIRVEAEVFLILEGGPVVFLVLFSCFVLRFGWIVDVKDFLGFPGGGRVIVDGLDTCLWLDDGIDGGQCFGEAGFLAWFEWILHVPWGQVGWCFLCLFPIQCLGKCVRAEL